MNKELFSLDEIDIYDHSYPAKMLKNELKLKFEQAEKFAEDVVKTLSEFTSVGEQIRKSMDKDFRFVVDMSNEMKQAIAKGEIKLSAENGNKLYAQVRKANGEYGEKLSIIREDFMVGIDPVQMANTLQLAALQEQLELVSQQIATIETSVREVLQGQQNDRVAMYYSGLALYLESKDMYDSEMQKALVAQSLKVLTEATFTLTMQMKADIKYLADKEYEKDKKNRPNLIDERISRIHKSFEVIHQSVILRAGIYCSRNELPAMASVLKEYSIFIDNTVAKNSHMLAQCDLSDDNTSNGVWYNRANLKLDVSELNRFLKSPNKTLYLSTVEGE